METCTRTIQGRLLLRPDEDFVEVFFVQFQKLPAFRHLSDEEYRAKVADEIRKIEGEAAAERWGNPLPRDG